ncbi:hypothetical protein NC652_024450 [Populus alba x Populus x berolinensis]|nr:hypothetical protein NC652_024450 [Populus alba x Populus x berolinensis]
MLTAHSLHGIIQEYGSPVGWVEQHLKVLDTSLSRILVTLLEQGFNNDGETGKCRGYGFVCYSTKAADFKQRLLYLLMDVELEGRALARKL